MKISKLFMLTATAIWTASASAQEVTEVHVWNEPQTWWGNHFAYVTDNLYTANEVSFDGFGSYLAGEEKFRKIFETNIRHGKWGGGVGLNYFFTRELGIGTDINVPDNRGNFIDSVSGSLIGRFPIPPSGFAPYVFGGGGRLTDPIWDWFGHVGVGLEYRLNPLTGLFSDARYVWGDKASDSLLLRFGMRFVF